jgi:organic radical activating enzyme
MAEGKSYTSNVSKLLKHLDKLQGLQNGVVSPIMVHLALTNICNLRCSFCCFANRKRSEVLSLDDVKSVLNQFRQLGTSAVEFTGGGEPLLHPNINDIAQYAYDSGYSLGVCTNGTCVNRIKNWDLFKWVRLGLYFVDNDYNIDIEYLKQFKQVDISGAYVWDNPNPDLFYKMINFAETHKIPTRIAVNAIKPTDQILRDMDIVSEQLSKVDRKYVFLSDFNLKTERRNNKCFVHMIKPFVFPDRNVYACPSAELAVENGINVNDEFKLCSIDKILEFYQKGVSVRNHNCSFCKYAQQNELIEDLLVRTTHNEFA